MVDRFADADHLILQAQQLIQGRLFTDVSGNGQWDAGVDVPYSNTPIVLLLQAVRKRAAGTEVATNVTNSVGQFVFDVTDNTVIPSGSNSNLGIATQADPNTLLKHFQYNPSNGTEPNVDVPVVVPVTVSYRRIEW